MGSLAQKRLVPRLFLVWAVLLGFAEGAAAGEPVEARLIEAWRWREIPRPVGAGPLLALRQLGDGSILTVHPSAVLLYDGCRWKSWGSPPWRDDEKLESVMPLPGGIACVAAGRVRVASPAGDWRTLHTLPKREFDAFLAANGAGRAVACFDDEVWEIDLKGIRPLFDAPPGGSHWSRLGYDASGKLWVLTSAGLFRREGTTWEGVKWPEDAPRRPEGGIFVIREREIWIVPREYVPGIAVIHWDGKELRVIREPSRALALRSLAPLGEQEFIASTRAGGLIHYRRGVWRIIEGRTGGPSQACVIPLLHEGKRLLVTDAAGSLWACDLVSERWQSTSAPEGLGGAMTNVLAPSRLGGLWLGTDGGVWRCENGQAADIVTEAAGIPLRGITALHEDAEGGLWVGSGAMFPGVLHHDGVSWRHLDDPAGTAGFCVHAIRPAADGGLWFLLLSSWPGRESEGGVAHYLNGRWRRFTTEHGLPHDRCYDLTRRPDGSEIIGTQRGIAEWRAELWTELLPRPSHRAFAIHADRSGDIWIATGLDCTALSRRREGAFLPLEGTAWQRATASAFLEDSSGSLWMTNHNGLFRFDGTLVHEPSREPGLSHQAFWPILDAGEGAIWLGSMGGSLVRHCPDDRQPPQILSLDAIRDVRTGSLIVRWEGIDPWHTTPASLLRYRWRLDGGAWSAAEASSALQIENLDAGAHRFEVQPYDLAGNTPEDAALLAFSIPPTFWSRAGVRVAAAAILLSLAALLAWIARQRRAARRHEQEALAASERHYRTLVEQSDLILVVIGRDGAIDYMSPIAERIFGRSVEEFKRYPECIRELIHPEDLPRRDEMARARADGDPRVLAAELRVRGQTPEWRHLLTRQAPRRDAQGGVCGYDLVSLDITERRRVEEVVERAERASSLGLLAGGVAHDFNNVLVSILGNAGLARSTLAADAPAQLHLAEIENASQRAANLCRQMLAYAGKAKVDFEPVELSEIVRETVRLLRISVPRNVTLHLMLASEPLPVTGDPIQLGQVIMNLLTNAVDAIGSAAGSVTFTTGAMFASRTYLEGGRLGADMSDGDYVFLEVSDTGSGMTAAEQEHIFEPFYTTKVGGHGLGLAATRGIVRTHHGAISLRSSPDLGTTFRILLPRAVQTASPSVPENPPPSKTVLVVDEDASVRATARAVLEAEGFRVLHASRAREALGILSDRGGGIDALLLDPQLPDMDGETLLASIRSAHATLPIVMADGEGLSEQQGAASFPTVTDRLGKPYGREALLRALRGVLDR